MAFVGLILLFIGFIFMISYPINKKKNARCSEQTQGELIKIRKRYDSEGSLKSKHVYSYEVDGIEYQLETLDHSPEVNNVGDTCTIWYNPKKPKDAQAYRGSAKYLKSLLLVGIALFLVGILVLCLSFVRSFIL